jgi:hypothetical protein
MVVFDCATAASATAFPRDSTLCIGGGLKNRSLAAWLLKALSAGISGGSR